MTAFRAHTCPVAGKRVYDSVATADAHIANMNRERERKGRLPYRGESYLCGDHWHIGRARTGFCRWCRVNLGRRDHKLTCPRRGVA